MKGAEQDDLVRLAGEVADRSTVDWDSEDRQATDPMRGKLRHLRLVEKIGELHRSIQEPGEAREDGPSSWGPLQIRERLGSGGFGEVYRAHDPSLNRDVALKLFHSEREAAAGPEELFLSEARQLARVRHPNVLVVHGADRHEGRVGLWTDLLEGKTLEQCLREQGTFGADEATLIGIDICRALAAVHAEGLVHRDVKTSNVMREAGGRIVLLDFSTVTDHGQTALHGTPAYMAPELFEGRDSGPAVDIYALGVLLYRLVSGRFPVPATALAELQEAHRKGASVPLRDVRPDLPTAFVRIVERALSADPADRYGSVGQMEQDLAAAVGSSGTGRLPATDTRPRRRLYPVAAAAAVLALVIGGAFLARQWLAPLRVDAALFRITDREVEERLGPGARVRLGDHLFIEINGSRTMHVYVINYDERGEGWALFPLPGLDLGNPLEAGIRHRLPGSVDGFPKYWDVTSEGGKEFMLVVASQRPMPLIEREMERLPSAGSVAPPQVSNEVITTLRGIGGLSSGPDEGGGPDERLSEISDRLATRGRTARGLWVWEVELESSAATPSD